MKTYKKPLARIIELESDALCVITSQVSVGEDIEGTDETQYLSNSYRKKLWED